jgi:hypothetical protein
MSDPQPVERVCPICQHEYAPKELTKHHLVPKSRNGKITVPLCRPCHRQIHALFTEKELEENFGTLEALLAAEALAPWIAWIRRRKPTAHVKTKTSKRKRR